MSTLPSSMNGSRFADTVSVHVILSGSMPSLAAMILPISTSKPSGSPLGPRRPNSGWSNLVPMVMLPLSDELGHRRAGLELGALLDLGAGAVVTAAGAESQGEGCLPRRAP